MVHLWSRLSLLVRFTIVSALIAVGLAVVLSSVTVQAIRAFAIKNETQVATELVLRTFAAQLRPADFQGPFPPERRAQFDELLSARAISDKILRVRLWRADGRLLYSNIPELDALKAVKAGLSSPGGYREFAQALQSVDEGTPDVGRFFVPVKVAGDPRTLGGFEIFYDLTPLHRRLDSTGRTIRRAVPLALFVSYAFAFVLVRRASRDLTAAHLGIFHALASAIDTKDSYTGDHSVRVAELAAKVARAMELPEDIGEVRMGARLHDLGKIGVPDAVLTKPGPLSPEEQVVMQRHAEAGSRILQQAPLSDEIKRATRHTHERWDGKGYPDGLTGEAIPLLARIIAVVDAYEVMTSDRSYRKAMSNQAALKRLQEGAGTQFDPRVVEVFVHLMWGTQ